MAFILQALLPILSEVSGRGAVEQKMHARDFREIEIDYSLLPHVIRQAKHFWHVVRGMFTTGSYVASCYLLANALRGV